MRGLLNALFVLKFDKIPPLLMKETVKSMQSDMPLEVVSKLYEVIDIKSKGLEKETVLRIPVLDEFFKQALETTYTSFNKREIDRERFNQYLQKILGISNK